MDERFQPGMQLGKILFGEAAAHVPNVGQLIALINAEHERAEMRSGAATFRESANDSLLSRGGLHLEPLAASDALSIDAVAILGHHSFQTLLCYCLKKSYAAFFNMLAEEKVRGIAKNLFQELFTPTERQVSQVTTIQIEKIECTIHQATPPSLGIMLQEVELRSTLLVERNNLAIDDCLMMQVSKRFNQ